MADENKDCPLEDMLAQQLNFDGEDNFRARSNSLPMRDEFILSPILSVSENQDKIKAMIERTDENDDNNDD